MGEKIQDTTEEIYVDSLVLDPDTLILEARVREALKTPRNALKAPLPQRDFLRQDEPEQGAAVGYLAEMPLAVR